jgi:GntR family transcriptional regulator / MocR family aminotransferase
MRRVKLGNYLTSGRGAPTPLYQQIYERFRQAISRGQLRPGDRLPSVRDLANELAMARGTIDAAYAMLAGEGYIVSRGPAGTIVSPELGNVAVTTTSASQPSPAIPQPLMCIEPKPLQLGLPALDVFPRKLWAHLVAREARRISPADMSYPDPAGFEPLRHAVAAYLAASRGIGCEWRQIVVTNGFQGGLDLALRTLLRPNDRVWIEDPCFPPVRTALEMTGAEVTPVCVDAEGMRVADGIRQVPKARMAIVTPSHQSPLGVALSLPRRLSLLRWAGKADAYVVEDDYDSEFRFVGRPLPALKSLDRQQRVIYAGTFSKTLFPALRLGYLVVPEDLLKDFIAASACQNAGQSLFAQHVVTAMMTEGYFARHLKRMRKLYSIRRQALVRALATEFGERIWIDVQRGGMHLLVRFTGGVHDISLARLTQSAGFGAEPLSKRAISHDCGQGLLVGFTNVPESQAPDVARRLRGALEPHRRGHQG